MAKAKALTYEELIDYAKKYYNRGGDGVYECWDRRTFDEYVSQFGPITKKIAREMFRDEYSLEKEMAAMSSW